MYIYKITNLLNGKIYIGKRITHKDIIEYYGSGIWIMRAIKKYGKENFKKELVVFCNTKKLLNEQEKLYIKLFNSTDKKIGYNICTGGNGGDTYTFNPNRKNLIEKISGKNHHGYGKIRSDEVKQKISKAMIGKKQKPKSNEWKMKQSILKTGSRNPNYGKAHTAEWKEQHSEDIKRYWQRRNRSTSNAV